MNIHLAVAGCRDPGPVDIDSHGILTISDHTGISVSNIECCGNIIANGGIRLLGIVSVGKITVCTGVVDVPAVNILTGICSIIAANVARLGSVDDNLTVFKVIDNFRCLAEADLGRNSLIFLSANICGKRTVFQAAAFITSSELIADNCTQSVIGQGINNVAFAICNGITTFVGCYFNRQHHGIAITDNNFIGLEGKLRDHDGNRSFTNHFIVINDLCVYFAFLTIGGKQSGVINGTEGSITQLPQSICGNLHFSTTHVSADGIELDCRTGGIVSIFSGNVRLVQITVCRSSGDEQNTGGGRTLRTIGGLVVNLQFLTRSLSNPSGGSAAITVNRIGTTQIQHHFCQFVHRHTGRVGRLTTIVNHNNNGAVGLKAYNRTGCCISVTMLVGVFIHAILHDVAAGTRDNLFFPTVKICSRTNLGHFHLGNIRRSGIAVLIKILVDNQHRGETDIAVSIATVSRIKVDFSIHHDESQRLINAVCCVAGVPAQCGVHGADNITITHLFSDGCLIGHTADHIIAVLRFHSGIAVDNLNIFIVEVRFHNKQHLAISTGVIIQNNLLFRNTRGDIPGSLGNGVVIDIIPLRIQGDILGQSNLCLICISSTSTIRLRVPSHELRSVTGEGVLVQLTRRDHLNLHGALTAVCVEGNQIGFLFNKHSQARCTYGTDGAILAGGMVCQLTVSLTALADSQLLAGSSAASMNVFGLFLHQNSFAHCADSAVFIGRVSCQFAVSFAALTDCLILAGCSTAGMNVFRLSYLCTRIFCCSPGRIQSHLLCNNILFKIPLDICFQIRSPICECVSFTSRIYLRLSNLFSQDYGLIFVLADTAIDVKLDNNGLGSRAFTLCFCSKDVHRNKANDHHYSQNHRKHADFPRMIHFVYFLLY